MSVEWSDDVIKGRYIWCDVTALLSLKMTTKVRDWFFLVMVANPSRRLRKICGSQMELWWEVM
jgi:hypothetical protein